MRIALTRPWWLPHAADFAELAALAFGASLFRRIAGLAFAAVRDGRPRRLLGPTVGAAVVVATGAFILWGVAIWLSWGGDCPGSGAGGGGLEKGIAVWPPAAQCLDRQGDPFWHQALPWAPWVIGVLITAAAAILLTGLVVAIRDLRRPAPVSSARALPLLEASFPSGGPAGGHRERHDDARGAERDPPAMAA